ncbi:MAG: sugar ABC transporter permease [Clostridiales bacterium]|jgi:ABC-type sugar transport system permease subunit|nr:sugar ABC transporter permease [Clostridiales bacterium]
MAKRYKHKHKKLTLDKNRAGYIFIAPFLAGFTLFMLVPLAQSLFFSFNEITILAGGGYATAYAGIKFYQRAFSVDPLFRVQLSQALQMVFTELPVVLAFSFFSALILSKNFRGRTAARVIFFLPVIVSVGIIASVENSNTLFAMMVNRDVAGAVDAMKPAASSMQFVISLLGSRLPEWLTAYVVNAVDRLYDIIIVSGIQTVIFLSGLNTIPPSIYESSDMEGATAWENFCKITFPIMGPYILLNAMYTIIDSFTNLSNAVVASIRRYIVGFTEFSYGSALSWIYFSIVFLVIGLVALIFGKKVFYYE